MTYPGARRTMSGQRFPATRARAVVLALALALSALAAAPGSGVRAQDAPPSVHVLRIDGMINPITERYLLRGIERAREQGAQLLLLEIDTPGGLLNSTQEMTSAFLASPLPVAVYVTPQGARAASAGVFITVAAHVAAMAPNTRIGAATPVEVDGGDTQGDLQRKILNDTVIYGRSLAEARGRNADWVESAVRDAVVVDAAQALELDVVDLLAASRLELLRALDGRTVTTTRGEHVLDTANARVEEHPMSAFERFFMLIADPTIALLLLSLGGVALYFELANPGAMIPGIVGVLFLILAFLSLGTLPINVAGLVLLALGLVLLGAELFIASGGILGVGGVVAFALGALLLIDESQAPFVEVSRPLIIALSVSLGAFVLVLMRGVMQARARPVAIGDGEWTGRIGRVRGPHEVFVSGELWHARLPSGEATLEPGQRVRVLCRDGLSLIVEPLAGEGGDYPGQTPERASTDVGNP